MPLSNLASPNFAHLQTCDEQLVRFGALAETYLADDPNTSLIKMRQFGELLAKHVATRMGLYQPKKEESQYELLRRLRDEGVLTQELYQLFGEIRRVGNAASHDNQGDQTTALNILKMGWQLGIWFQRTYFKQDFEPGPFVIPTSKDVKGIKYDRETIEAIVKKRQAAIETLLRKYQTEAEGKHSQTIQKYRLASSAAGSMLVLDEAQTRQLIDWQLSQAGWEADTVNLRYNKGTRPERSRNLAIAEYPTGSGPADYVLFVGLTPVAVVEAKRKNVDVSAALQQAKRYSRNFAIGVEMQSPGNSWDGFRIPFAFSTNGRPRFPQMETQSGIWFVDLRRPENLSHALEGWYTPGGLITLLKRDEVEAHKQLDAEPLEFGFPLRYYQSDLAPSFR